MRQSGPARDVVVVNGAGSHLSQLHSGLALLHKAGAIRLSQRIARPDSLPAGTCIVEVDDAKLVVDVCDADDLYGRGISAVDFYAKRSYRAGGYHLAGTTVLPYGLNYPVYRSGVDLRLLRRLALPGKDKIGAGVARAFAVDRILGRPMTPRTSDISPRPATVQSDGAQVIFLARVWAPPGDPLHPDTANDRDQLNEKRAACIRELRKELGPRFVGGLAPTEHARRYYADCLAEGSQTEKRMYLQLASRIPIGVTTTGLQSSTGWKFGEYVAMGRAIVTEPLLHEVPGPFASGKNYLTFNTPDECVEECRRLIDNPEHIAEMSRANASYFDDYVRPDRLVANILARVAPDRSS